MKTIRPQSPSQLQSSQPLSLLNGNNEHRGDRGEQRQHFNCKKFFFHIFVDSLLQCWGVKIKWFPIRPSVCWPVVRLGLDEFMTDLYQKRHDYWLFHCNSQTPSRPCLKTGKLKLNNHLPITTNAHLDGNDPLKKTIVGSTYIFLQSESQTIYFSVY